MAFQAHEDTSTVSDLALRLSRHVPASTGEIEAALLRTDVAVLGVVPRLLHARGDGVQWAPGDNLSIAGELLVTEPTNAAWGMRGTITELEPA